MRATKRKAAARKPVRAIRRRKVAKKKVSRPATAIVVRHLDQTAIVRAESVVPSVMRTVQSLEQVRRFVSKCLNTDLQRRIAKLKPGEKLPDEERKRLEVDWGTIPGVDKPFLLQPGSEKFLFWLNIRPKFSTYTTELSNGHLEVVSHVTFYSKKTREEVFEGPDCSCTSMESNYRFRFQERDPKKAAPSQEEAAELKVVGLGKWRKKDEWKGGKKVGEKWIWLDRVENPNIYDERNKVRQIAEKRALVKGVKNMGAMSEIFVTNPEEWEIPEEVDQGPDVDQRYTEGGRRIVTDEKKPEQPTYEERAAAAMDKIKQEGFDRETTQKDAPNTRAVIFYTHYPHKDDPEKDTYRINGSLELMKANREVFKAVLGDGFGWSPVAKAVICTPSQLGKLISRFEDLKVSFRDTQAKREPSE